MNPVNCQGMVKGKKSDNPYTEFKNRWPEMFRRYQQSCWSHELVVGNCLIDKEQDPWIILFPVKHANNNNVKMEWIVESLASLAEKVIEWGVESMAMPILGYGLVDKNKTMPTLLIYRDMQKALGDLSIPIEVRIPEAMARDLPAQDFFWPNLENNPLYMEGATDAVG